MELKFIPAAGFNDTTAITVGGINGLSVDKIDRQLRQESQWVPAGGRPFFTRRQRR